MAAKKGWYCYNAAAVTSAEFSFLTTKIAAESLLDGLGILHGVLLLATLHLTLELWAVERLQQLKRAQELF